MFETVFMIKKRKELVMSNKDKQQDISFLDGLELLFSRKPFRQLALILGYEFKEEVMELYEEEVRFIMTEMLIRKLARKLNNNIIYMFLVNMFFDFRRFFLNLKSDYLKISQKL